MGTSNLDRLLGLVADKGGTSYGRSADASFADAEEQQAHDLLRRECPWYLKATAGAPVADTRMHCQHAEGAAEPPRLVVKLTPRTPEASTVDKPTVPPGGPGLFHVKGLHLPPYIQHLWFHLVKEYGEKKAYGVAVGVVKKWAAGINPGGRHPTRTHPDVQAAAARNVAQWEADKAKAHAQSRERDQVRAAVTLAAPGSAGQPAYPGSQDIPLPPVPPDPVARAMFTAHRADGFIHSLTHAAERFKAACKEPDPALRRYHVTHLRNHLGNAADTGHLLADNVRRNYPAEGRELDALHQTIGLARSLSPAARAATFSHLLETVLYNVGHAKRHAEAMGKTEPEALWQFNADHCGKHLVHALEHAQKFAEHLRDNYPAECRHLEGLPVGSPPYVARLSGPGVALSDGGGGSLGGGAVVTAPGAQKAFIPPPPGGKYSAYGLHQKPSQTVSPSPPLPPKVEVPAPGEVRALIPQVPECADVTLSATVAKFLEGAAVKLEKNDEMQALSMLRATGMAVIAAHKADLGQVLPAFYTAGVFTRVPPAGQSSAGQAVLEGHRRAEQWRKLELAVQALADRIRKRFFRGVYNGPSQQARLSARLG